MTHDPLCTFAPCECYKDGSGMHSCGTETCQCDLIAKVRADERKRHMVRAPEYGSGSWSSGSMTSGTQVTWQ